MTGTEETLRLTIAALMRLTRERQGEVAAAIGTKPSAFSRKFGGQTKLTFDDADALAAHWGMPTLDLLAGPTHAADKLPERLRLPAGTQQALTPVAEPPKSRKATKSTEPAVAPALAVDGGRVAFAEEPDRDAFGSLVRAELAPCVLCGVPVENRAAGQPQHQYGKCPPREPVESTPPAEPDTNEDATGRDGVVPAPEQALPREILPPDMDEGGRIVQALPEPCVLCGQPVTARAGGRPQHAMGMCLYSAPSTVAAVEIPTPEPSDKPAGRDQDKRHSESQDPSELAEYIHVAVEGAVQKTGGDFDAALEELKRIAIPTVMHLFNRTRATGRYEHSVFPPTDEVLRKTAKERADQIWEARPDSKWRNPAVIKGAEVTALDMNAMYLNAFNCHLPIGQLVEGPPEHNPKRAGVYLITPPKWVHEHLPNPMGGERKKKGDVWVSEETLRLLLELADADLCDPPRIVRSLVSGATESLLKKMRRTLVDVREKAIEENDELTYEFVKSLYSKFVSTSGESPFNDQIRRPDWMHIIRAKANANMIRLALRADEAGLLVARVTGTDELHVVGNWREATIQRRGKTVLAFPEGRSLSQVKAKNVYTVGGKR
ncbi:acyltransferase [Streptomyces sp. NPDC090442]|uniref:acyltransferase n=1 Tax=Streptomyces sp. NPDC090442 TaxID=3365962 RepID=UPI0037FFAFCB